MRLPGPIVTCIGTRQEAECWEGLKRYLEKADEDPLSQLGARGRVMSASHLQVRVEEGNDPQTGVLRGRGSAFACVVEPWRVADGDEQALGAQQPGSDLGRRLRTGLVDEPMVLGLVRRSGNYGKAQKERQETGQSPDRSGTPPMSDTAVGAKMRYFERLNSARGRRSPCPRVRTSHISGC